MTRFERWFLKRLLRREVLQGHDHDQRIAGLYSLIREACEKEFFEDNAPTLSAFLAECFEQTQRKLAAIHDETGGGRLILGPVQSSTLDVLKQSVVDLECVILLADAELAKQAAKTDTATPTPAIKLCRDCKHADTYKDSCVILCKRIVDPVWGEGLDCSHARRGATSSSDETILPCSPDGAFWEAREVQTTGDQA